MSDIISDVVIPDIIPDIMSDIIYVIVSCDYFFQVEKLVRLLKHKLRPENANFNAHNFDAILSAPKEELHQFLIGLYGDHLLPATKYEIKSA